MIIKKIKPVSRIARYEAEINRIIGEAFLQKHDILGLDEGWIPRIDIYEGKKDIIIETEIPGVSQKDITICLHSNRIEIRGSKKEDLPSEKIEYLRLEREFGIFRRVIYLPGMVIPEKTKATLRNGILIIVLKKLKQKEKKEVFVEIK